MKTIITRFMSTYHHLSDKDFIWFPLMFLRPAPHEVISFSRLVAMTICFGLYAALIWPLKQYLMSSEITWQGQIIFTLKCLGFFAVWFSCVTRPLWNQRARDLKKT